MVAVVGGLVVNRRHPLLFTDVHLYSQQVDDKHIRMLHPYAAGGKSKHRSKTQSSHSDNNNTPGVDKADMALPEVDIVDAHFPRPHSIDSKGEFTMMGWWRFCEHQEEPNDKRDAIGYQFVLREGNGHHSREDIENHHPHYCWHSTPRQDDCCAARAGGFVV